jgi:hypothetical protein
VEQQDSADDGAAEWVDVINFYIFGTSVLTSLRYGI